MRVSTCSSKTKRKTKGNGTMAELRFWLAGSLIVCAGLGCAQSKSPASSSETHFLMRCTDDCGEGLQCICGVCSAPCERNDSCAALPGNATCHDSTSECGAAE